MPKKAKKPAAKKIKKAVKKPVKKKATTKVAQSKPKAKPKQVAPKKPPQEVVQGTLLGKVEDYYSHVNVIAMTLASGVSVGDTIRVKGHTTDLIQKVDSMEIDHAPATTTKAGDSVGIKVTGRCRKGDRVYKI